MQKSIELTDPLSCLNKAEDDETLFVLLARDPAAPATIRGWCSTRVTMGLNVWTDKQIQEALFAADRMQEYAILKRNSVR